MIERELDGERALFVREFLRAPLRTAAVTPSSGSLGARMIAPIPERGDPVVVELGPGTGAFTGPIQRRLDGRGRHLAIELNTRLAGMLARRHPGVEVVQADAAELPDVLAERGLMADVVVSGLPWAAFGSDPRCPLLWRIGGVLAAGGAYTQFTYAWSRWTPPARRQRRQLHEVFEETVLSRTVWRNLPPALVYLARRPRVPAGCPELGGTAATP